ncbi:MAG TPA: carbamate kinase, partial [archaeon]|nr:carbamate kinase [archaeon]
LIGALLQEALDPALLRAGVRKPVVTVVTQVLVDRADPAFRAPTKPIGPFYRSRSGLPRSWRLVRTEHGWRRVVPSPEPRSILEAKTIQEASAHSVVVACGGGGVPVVRAPPDAGRSLRQRGAGQLRGVDAVIDKDLTAALLAKAVGARELIILTDVDAVFLDYGTKQQLALRAVTASQLRGYQKEGHFPPGSMGPKVEAALRFLRSNPRGRVRITSFAKLEQALAGRAGTRITA